MKPFALTQKAKSDLFSIAVFTQERRSIEQGIEQRNIYLKQFDDLFHQLAANLLLGKSCDDILAGYRKLPPK
jgi:toxin ParE1/3/4